MRKKCSKCGKTRLLSKFKKDPRYRNGVTAWCSDCYAEYNKTPARKKAQKTRWKRYISDPKNREYERLRSRRKYHKNPDAQYDRVLRKERGVSLRKHRRTKSCLLCKRKVRLVADHNHETNKYRGALYHICNLMIAWVERAPNALKKIRKYLRRG